MIPHPSVKKRKTKIDRAISCTYRNSCGCISLAEACRESRITYPFVCACKFASKGVVGREGREQEESVCGYNTSFREFTWTLRFFTRLDRCAAGDSGLFQLSCSCNSIRISCVPLRRNSYAVDRRVLWTLSRVAFREQDSSSRGKQSRENCMSRRRVFPSRLTRRGDKHDIFTAFGDLREPAKK